MNKTLAVVLMVMGVAFVAHPRTLEAQTALGEKAVMQQAQDVFCNDQKIMTFFKRPCVLNTPMCSTINQSSCKGFAEAAQELYGSISSTLTSFHLGAQGATSMNYSWVNYCNTVNQFISSLKTPDDVRRAFIVLDEVNIAYRDRLYRRPNGSSILPTGNKPSYSTHIRCTISFAAE
jgi:hypothetical protein